VQVVDVVRQVPKQIHEERVRQVPRTELAVQEVTSPRAITRTTQQVVTNNQQVAAPLPAGHIGVTQGTTVQNIGNVGVLGSSSAIGGVSGGIIGGTVSGGIIGASPVGAIGGSTIIGGGSHYVGGGSVGVPVSNSVVVGQRFP